jgi:hypothetical protein
LAGSSKLSYVEISKEEFEKALEPYKAQEETHYSHTEFEYRIEVRQYVFIRVYSSISVMTGWARSLGKDAIRLMLMNEQQLGKEWPIMKEKRTHRTNGWQARMLEKIEELKTEGMIVRLCPNDHSALKLRQGPYGEFYGCPMYPNCRYTEHLVKVKA